MSLFGKMVGTAASPATAAAVPPTGWSHISPPAPASPPLVPGGLQGLPGGWQGLTAPPAVLATTATAPTGLRLEKVRNGYTVSDSKGTIWIAATLDDLPALLREIYVADRLDGGR